MSKDEAIRANDGTMWVPPSEDSPRRWTGSTPGEDVGSINVLNTDDMRHTYPEVVARWEARSKC